MKKYFSLVLLSIGICYGAAQEENIHSQLARSLVSFIVNDDEARDIGGAYLPAIEGLKRVSELSCQEDAESQNIGRETMNFLRFIIHNYFQDIKGDDAIRHKQDSLKVLSRVCRMTFVPGSAGLGGKQIPYIQRLVPRMMEGQSIDSCIAIFTRILHSFAYTMAYDDAVYEQVVQTTIGRLLAARNPEGPISSQEIIHIFEGAS